MTAPPARTRLHRGDLRGLSQLGIDGLVGVTDLVESVHHTITSGTGVFGRAPAGRTRGITGLVYGAVRGGMRGVGAGLRWLSALAPAGDGTSGAARDAAVSALNGAWGDHLEATANPLAISMSLRIDARPWREALVAPRERLVVLVHGLGMNDRQWCRRGHDHGRMLADTAGCSAVYLHYNSGRHVSTNGRAFSRLLDELVAEWPVPVRELMIVGHSMGGLVARSACHAGAGSNWRQRLTTLVFLGTPHHGAPLERGVRWLDTLLGVSPYVASFARLGKVRSAGITDLRFGNLQDADWQHRDRHAQHTDDRVPTPLPAGVAACFVAATQAAQETGLRSAALGDGLVPVASALGRHRRPTLRLAADAAHRLVVTRAGHWDLLDHPEVAAALRRWLA